MSHKIAVVLETVPGAVSSRGAGKHSLNMFMSLGKAGCIVDIYCLQSANEQQLPYINSINFLQLDEKEELNKEFFISRGYDFVLMDILKEYSTLTLMHPHSMIYRQEVVRTPFEKFIKRIFNAHRMVTPQMKSEYIKKMNAVDDILANSQIAYEDYTKYCNMPAERVHVVHPYIEVTREFAYSPQSVFTFGMNGTTFSLKGGFIFLKALHCLKKAKRDFQAKIIYANYKKNMILRFFVFLYGLKNNIIFLGMQENMQDFYGSIDCLVSPSREDTFGLVMLEAMASGKITIISTRCGAKDIIRDGENGYVFNFDNNPEKALFEKMKYVIDNKGSLKQVYESAYATVKECSMDNHGVKMLQILDKIKQRKALEISEKINI